MLHFLNWLNGGRPEEAHVNTIGDRIKEARKRARLSQEALARRAGMSTNGVARIEQGGIADPHYSTLVGIAGALGVSLGGLLEEEPVLAGKAEAPPGPGRTISVEVTDEVGVSDADPEIRIHIGEFRALLAHEGVGEEQVERIVAAVTGTAAGA
jgi:transcriptional regulator with XRE-family HTH domain